MNKHIYLFLQVNKRQKFINKLFNNKDTLCLLKNIFQNLWGNLKS